MMVFTYESSESKKVSVSVLKKVGFFRNQNAMNEGVNLRSCGREGGSFVGSETRKFLIKFK